MKGNSQCLIRNVSCGILTEGLLFQENNKCRERNCSGCPRSRKRKTTQVRASEIWGQVLNRMFQALIDDRVQMILGMCAHDTKLGVWIVAKTNRVTY